MGEGLCGCRRKLPKLRSVRASLSEGLEHTGERAREQFTASVAEKILASRRGDAPHGGSLTGHGAGGAIGEGPGAEAIREMAQRFDVDEPTLEAVLQYYGDIPEYRAKRLELHQLAK